MPATALHIPNAARAEPRKSAPMARPDPPLSFLRIHAHCRECRYPLRGSSTDRCPECGEPTWRELTEDDSRPLNARESALLNALSPRALTETAGRAYLALAAAAAIPIIALAAAAAATFITPIAPSLAAGAAGAAALTAAIAILWTNRRAIGELRLARRALARDRAEALAAVCHLEIESCTRVRGPWDAGNHADRIMLQGSRDLTLLLGFRTVQRILPDIADRAPAHLAIDFLPSTGVVLTARPIGDGTIPTQSRHAARAARQPPAFIPTESRRRYLLLEGEPTPKRPKRQKSTA